jgi:hypothetical protein
MDVAKLRESSPFVSFLACHLLQVTPCGIWMSAGGPLLGLYDPAGRFPVKSRERE